MKSLPIVSIDVGWGSCVPPGNTPVAVFQTVGGKGDTLTSMSTHRRVLMD